MDDYKLQSEISYQLDSNLWELMDKTIFTPGQDPMVQRELGIITYQLNCLRENNVNVRFIANLRSFLNFNL